MSGIPKEPRKQQGVARERDIARRARGRAAAEVSALRLVAAGSGVLDGASDYAHRLLLPGNHRGGTTGAEHSGITGSSHGAIIRRRVTVKTHHRFSGVTFRSDGLSGPEQIRVYNDPEELGDDPVLLLDHCIFVRPEGSWKTHIVVDANCYAVLINPTFVGGTEDDPDGTTACVIQNNAALANVVVVGGHNDTGNCIGNVTPVGGPVGGPTSTLITTITVSTTLTGAYGIILADATAGAITVTLPAAADYKEKLFSIKKIDSSANIVTVAAASGETIDEATSHLIPVQYVSIDVVSDGTEWWIV